VLSPECRDGKSLRPDNWNFLGLLEGMGALPQGTLRLALAGELKVARGMA
jgi:hypothetical protein